MASFTDEITQFNPFIQTLPVQEMVQTGMILQENYNRGVEKVQTYIDNIAGIDVMKDEHKQYLTQRVKQLETEVSKVVGGDFARHQLVTAVGGLTKQISSDKVVQNAIASTQRARKGQAALEEARTTGKGYSVENEYFFQNQLSKWLGDKSTDTPFSANYIPYTDVKKKILDVIKTVDPSSTLTQMPFVTDAQGNVQLDPTTGQPELDYAMVERYTKGKDPSKLVNAIQSSLDENDLRQIGISGAYHYRNYTPQDMKKVVDANTIANGNNLTVQLDLLRVKSMNSVGEEKDAIDEQMGLIEESLKGINKDYTTAISTLSTNPDGFKQQFYTENLVRGMGQAFSSSETYDKFVSNPKFQGYMEEQKLKLGWAELAQKQVEAELKRQEAAAKANKADKTKGNETSGAGNPFPVGEGDMLSPTEMSFNDATAALIGQKDAVVNQAVGLAFPEIDFNANARKLKIDPQVYKEMVFEGMVDDYKQGKEVPQHLTSSVKQVIEMRRDIDTRKSNIGAIYAQTDKNFPSLKRDEIIKGITGGSTPIRGKDNWWEFKSSKNVDFTPEDIVNIATIQVNKGNFKGLFANKEEDRKIADAEKAIRAKFGDKADDILLAANAGSLTGIAPQLEQVGKLLRNPQYQKRQEFINQRLNETGLVGAPVSFDLRTGKPEELRNVKDQVASILFEAKKMGGGPDNRSDIIDKLTQKEGTSFSVIWQPKGENNPEHYQLVVKDLKGKGETIDISQRRAEQLTDRIFDSNLNSIETKIRSTATKSTNATGKPEDSFLNKEDFPLINKYPVQGDVYQDALNPDLYYMKLHLFNPNTQKYITKDLKLGEGKARGITLTEVQNVLHSLRDADVEAIMSK